MNQNDGHAESYYATDCMYGLRQKGWIRLPHSYLSRSKASKEDRKSMLMK